MSWEAVTWANNQKLKKTYEQCILLVLANCADPNGECFVKWPGRDHWWVYLSEKTRLPKSSLFRHLNVVMALGLGQRSEIVMADGSRRPTFKLDLTAKFDIEDPEDEQRYNAVTSKGSHESQSQSGTENDDEPERAENDSNISDAPDGEASQSQSGTGKSSGQSHSGTGPFPVLGMQKDSSILSSKDSPLPPSGGLPVRDDLWDQFIASWGEPIPKMALARSAWDHTETAKRAEIVAAAKGYWTWLKGHSKPPSAQSAQSFIRDAAGWAQWLRYVPTADGKAPPIVTGYARSCTEARALINLHDALGVGDGFRRIFVRDVVNYSKPMTPQIAAFADMPARPEWVEIDRNGAGAWSRFGPSVSMISRLPAFREGDRAPWIFPPSETGKIYTATGPPTPTMTEDDHEALANEGR